MITLTREIPGGTRRTTFDASGNAVSMMDDFGQGGTTRFDPPEEWADPEDVKEARARLAAVTEPRRRRKKPVPVAEAGQSAIVFEPVSAKSEGG